MELSEEEQKQIKDVQNKVRGMASTIRLASQGKVAVTNQFLSDVADMLDIIVESTEDGD